jgi:hypothetical protein
MWRRTWLLKVEVSPRDPVKHSQVGAHVRGIYGHAFAVGERQEATIADLARRYQVSSGPLLIEEVAFG